MNRDQVFMTLAGLNLGMMQLASDATMVGTALARALQETGCAMHSEPTVAADGGWTLHMVSPAGMMFDVTMRTTGVAIMTGEDSNNGE